MKNLLFMAILAGLFSTIGIASETKAPNPNDIKITSALSPYYFCYPSDLERTVQIHRPRETPELLAVALYGRVDMDKMAQAVTKLTKQGFDLHEDIANLFSTKLANIYGKNNYIGTHAHVGGDAPAGYFGGISIITLGVLNSLKQMQDALPADQKMRFLGVGSGNAFFEYLLSQIGETSAMDVLYPKDTDKTSAHGKDSYHLRTMREQKKLFMPVKTYQYSSEQMDKIVEQTFPEDNYQNTILVLSWPREYAFAYIHKFIQKGGQSIIFVRGQVVGSIFHKEHLGELGGDNAKFKAYLSKKLKVSIDLNTATLSTIDLYSTKDNTPVEQALKMAAATFSLGHKR